MSSGAAPRDGADPDRPAVLATERLLEAPPIAIERSRIRLSGGREAERVVVRHPGAVAIVALDDEERWILVRQHRFPAGRDLLEVPAGTREPGEEPRATAARELREETGFAAGEITSIGGFFTAPGFCDEFIHLFLARDLTRDPLPPDDDEEIRGHRAVAPAALLEAASSGEIEDAKTLSAIAVMAARGGPGAPAR